MTDQVCYTSFPGKRRDFVKRTVPTILKAARHSAQTQRAELIAWMDRNGVLSIGEGPMLEALHDAARRGRYVETQPGHCDVVQDALATIEHGGDCDQWAVVLLACCALLDVRANLVSFGDDSDPHQHVAVVAELYDSAFVLDPKGNQYGAGFNEWPRQELTGGWKL